MRSFDELVKRKTMTHTQYKRNSSDGVDWQGLGFTFNFKDIPGGIIKTGYENQENRSQVIIDDFQSADALVAVSDFEKFRQAHAEMVKKYPKNFLTDKVGGIAYSEDVKYKPITNINALEGYEFTNFVNYVARKAEGILDIAMADFFPYEFVDGIPRTRIVKGAYYMADQWTIEYLHRCGVRKDNPYPYIDEDIVVLDENNKEVCLDGSTVHPIALAYDHTPEFHSNSFPEGKKYFPKLNNPVCIRPEYGVPKGELDYQPNKFGIYHAAANVMKVTSSRNHEGQVPKLFTSMYSKTRPNVASAFEFETFNDV